MFMIHITFCLFYVTVMLKTAGGSVHAPCMSLIHEPQRAPENRSLPANPVNTLSLLDVRTSSV
jgi:hypothetical protein